MRAQHATWSNRSLHILLLLSSREQKSHPNRQDCQPNAHCHSDRGVAILLVQVQHALVLVADRSMQLLDLEYSKVKKDMEINRVETR